MRHKKVFFVLFFFLFLGTYVNSEAKLKKYMQPVDMSALEWQILNWSMNFRGTTIPADPFILNGMEYDRGSYKINIYLSGKSQLATDSNLKKSVVGITGLFQQRFPDFDAKNDLIVHYNLKPEKEGADTDLEYSQGSFGPKGAGVESPSMESVY